MQSNVKDYPLRFKTVILKLKQTEIQNNDVPFLYFGFLSIGFFFATVIAVLIFIHFFSFKTRSFGSKIK